MRVSLRLVAFGTLGGAVFGCSGATSEDPVGSPVSQIHWARSATGPIAVDGEEVARLASRGAGWELSAPGVAATLSVDEVPITREQPYPRRVTTTAAFGGHAVFEDRYTLLAPPAPLPVEGYGLVVSDDEPGTNDEEHAALESWLAAQGLAPDAGPFQELHAQETGRELRVWYEMSGRRRDARFARVGEGADLARTRSLFRSENGELKIHHKRPGENGRFDYHRQSLERASALESGHGPALISHECGCYGYAIASDYMTLGDSLYHVVADWLDDRVAAEFFIGFERRDSFPGFGLGDRRRMRNLARRAAAWELSDAAGVPFAAVVLDLPADPPPGELGEIGYDFLQFDAQGTQRRLARIRHTSDAVVIDLYGPSGDDALNSLDRLLAAMPTQVERGDGIRDSHLDEIERLIDAVRLARDPDESRLADFASPVDAWTAAGKVRALLASEPDRYAAVAETRPPEPIPGPGPRQHVRAER